MDGERREWASVMRRYMRCMPKWKAAVVWTCSYVLLMTGVWLQMISPALDAYRGATFDVSAHESRESANIEARNQLAGIKLEVSRLQSANHLRDRFKGGEGIVNGGFTYLREVAAKAGVFLKSFEKVPDAYDTYGRHEVARACVQGLFLNTLKFIELIARDENFLQMHEVTAQVVGSADDTISLSFTISLLEAMRPIDMTCTGS